MADFCSKEFTLTIGELGLSDLTRKAFCVGSEVPAESAFSTLHKGPGATAPYDWEVIEGADNLASHGFTVALDVELVIDPELLFQYFTLNGTPSVPGAAVFTVQVRDSALPDNNAAEREFTVWAAQINQSAGALAAGAIGQDYNTSPPTATFTQEGAPAVVNWKVSAGSLPAGLVLNGMTGAITGIPTAAGITSTFTITLASSGA